VKTVFGLWSWVFGSNCGSQISTKPNGQDTEDRIPKAKVKRPKTKDQTKDQRPKAKGQRPKTQDAPNLMAQDFLSNYKAKHQHPLNRLTHSIGIPMIVVSLPLFFFSWKWALALFIVGWILQFVGHAIEGNQPAFFRNPIYLLVGPLWLVRRTAAAVGLAKKPATK
jgi:hypothetical protein